MMLDVADIVLQRRDALQAGRAAHASPSADSDLAYLAALFPQLLSLHVVYANIDCSGMSVLLRAFAPTLVALQFSLVRFVDRSGMDFGSQDVGGDVYALRKAQKTHYVVSLDPPSKLEVFEVRTALPDPLRHEDISAPHALLSVLSPYGQSLSALSLRLDSGLDSQGLAHLTHACFPGLETLEVELVQGVLDPRAFAYVSTLRLHELSLVNDLSVAEAILPLAGFFPSADVRDRVAGVERDRSEAEEWDMACKGYYAPLLGKEGSPAMDSLPGGRAAYPPETLASHLASNLHTLKVENASNWGCPQFAALNHMVALREIKLDSCSMRLTHTRLLDARRLKFLSSVSTNVDPFTIAALRLARGKGEVRAMVEYLASFPDMIARMEDTQQPEPTRPYRVHVGWDDPMYSELRLQPAEHLWQDPATLRCFRLKAGAGSSDTQDEASREYTQPATVLRLEELTKKELAVDTR